MSQNHHVVIRDTVVEGSRYFDHLGFFIVHPNLSTWAHSIFGSIENAAAAAMEDCVYMTETKPPDDLKARITDVRNRIPS